MITRSGVTLAAFAAACVASCSPRSASLAAPPREAGDAADSATDISEEPDAAGPRFRTNAPPDADDKCAGAERSVLEGTDVVVVSTARRGATRICEIRSGQKTLYPYDCDARPLPTLCSGDAIELRDKGCDLTLVTRDDRGGVHRLLLSGECYGNTMCASFGLWMLTVTPERVVASPPVVDCFGGADARVMSWNTLTLTPPPRIDGRTSKPKRYDPISNRWVAP